MTNGVLYLDGNPLVFEGASVQQLSLIDTDGGLSEAIVSVSGGSLQLDGVNVNTDEQDLGLSDTSLTITDGTGVDLDNTFATDSELATVAQSVTTLETTVLGGTTNAALTLADGDGDGADTLTTTNGVLYLNGVAVDTDTTIADDQQLNLSRQ